MIVQGISAWARCKDRRGVKIVEVEVELEERDSCSEENCLTKNRLSSSTDIGGARGETDSRRKQ